MWNRDAGLWTGHDEARWLGWLDIASQQLVDLESLDRLQRDVRNGGFHDVVVLGMGGSSLAPDVLSRTFGRRPDFPQLRILDSTVPDQIATLESQLDLSKTLFVVASKSGTTAEPIAFESYFFDKVGNGSQFIAVTDPGTALEEMARSKDEAIRTHLDLLEPGDYFAIHAYLEMSPEHHRLLQAIRERVRDRKRVATTLGYGPRFLHSTGQLHKGGPNRGVFLQLTADSATGLHIPGQRLSFGQLNRFRASGDFRGPGGARTACPEGPSGAGRYSRPRTFARFGLTLPPARDYYISDLSGPILYVPNSTVFTR